MSFSTKQTPKIYNWMASIACMFLGWTACETARKDSKEAVQMNLTRWYLPKYSHEVICSFDFKSIFESQQLNGHSSFLGNDVHEQQPP